MITESNISLSLEDTFFACFVEFRFSLISCMEFLRFSKQILGVEIECGQKCILGWKYIFKIVNCLWRLSLNVGG